ncbi:MAG TPA: PAS domain S-box protein [Flavobacterium sp.]|jgi:PAS domain S-box-containing protein
MFQNTSGLNVLIVEDNLGDYILIEDYLNEAFDSPVLLNTSTFKETEDILQSDTGVDVVLLDLTLPDLSGEALMKQITALADDIPVIVLTGFGDKDYGFKSLSFGIADYLYKDELSASQLHKSITYGIERKKFSKKFKESEEKYKNLFQFSPSPNWIYDPVTFRFLDVNDAAIEHYGYTREEFLSMDLLDIRPPELRKDFLPILQDRLKRESSTKQTFQHQKKNGEKIDVEIQSKDINFDGKVARLVLATDVTDRLRSARGLEESEKRFKTLVQEGGDLITILDPAGVFIYASPNHKALLGYDIGQMVRRQYDEFIHPDDIQKQREFIKSIPIEKRIYSTPYRILSGDGAWIWIESIGTDAQDDASINGLVLNSRDVTKRVESDREIKEINERFKAIAKATSDAIYDYDFASGKIFLVGSSYHALFGYDFEDNITTIDFFKACLHPDEKKRVFDTLNAAAENPTKTHYEYEYRFLRHDGTYATVLDRFDIIWNNGSPIKKVGAMQDISTRKFQETILAFEKEIYELNANPNIDFEYVIDKLVGSIELLIPEAMCTIMLLEFDQTSKHIAGNSLDKEFIETIDGLALEPFASAKKSAKTVIVTNIESDPRWDTLREGAQRYGLKTCWSIPVRKSSGKVIANFAMYFKSVRVPHNDEINLVERVSSLIGVLIENRNAVEETERAKGRYDIVAKATSDTIWDWNIQQDHFVWNKGIQGVFGYRKEDVGHTSKWWFDRIHPEDSIKMSVKLYSFLEQKTEKWQDEYRFACADGSYKYVFDRGFLVKDANGKAIRMIGAMQDVTKQKEEEQRLKLLETVITQMKDSVIITESEKASDTVPKIVFVNPAFTAMTGYDASEVIGQSPSVFMDRKSVQNDIGRLSTALKSKEEFRFETLNNKKDGEEYWVNFSMIPITNKEGEHSHWISIQRDITDEKKQEKEKEQLIRELTQNNKDLKQFSYITSHNLRAPLSNLTGLLNLIEDIPIEDPILKEILSGFSKSTYLLNETINDLVKVVIIKDNPSIQKEEVLIMDVFENVFNQLSFLISLHKPLIKLDLEKVTILNINKAYLESILLNLLTNAIKYRAADRKLKISVMSRMVDDSIILIFKDNGIGIDMQRNKDKIFGLYQRFHNYSDSKGLGLYLVKSQVESMGGTITVDSVVNKGTTFELTFKKQVQ